MSSNLPEKVKNRINKQAYDRIINIDINLYLNNPQMIKNLHQERSELFLKNHNLESNIEECSSKIHILELNNKELATKLASANRDSIVSLIISLFIAILMGIGVNFATGDKSTWAAGLIMIILAVGLYIVNIIILLIQRNQK